MLKIRRPLGRLIFNMGITIPGKTVFLIETAPWCSSENNFTVTAQHYILNMILKMTDSISQLHLPGTKELIQDKQLSSACQGVISQCSAFSHWSWDKMAAILHTLSKAFSCIKARISYQILLKYIPWGLTDNTSALVQIMTWCLTGNKPLPKKSWPW